MPFITRARLRELEGAADLYRRQLEEVLERSNRDAESLRVELRAVEAQARQLERSIARGNEREALLRERCELLRDARKIEIVVPDVLRVLAMPEPKAAPVEAPADEPLPPDISEACDRYAFPGSPEYKRERAANRAKARQLLAAGIKPEGIIAAIRTGRIDRDRQDAAAGYVLNELDRGGISVESD